MFCIIIKYKYKKFFYQLKYFFLNIFKDWFKGDEFRDVTSLQVISYFVLL